MADYRIAVFASGSGTNFQNLVERSRDGRLPVDVALLVTDKPGCKARERAEKFEVPTFVAPPSEFEDRAAMERAIGAALEDARIDLVVLAGFMRILGKELVSAWRHRMINLHPSLLPSFRGINAVGQALEAGVKVTGATVHIVDEGLDTGPIVAQEAFPIPEGATREEVEETLHAVEHELLAKVVGWFATDCVRCEGRHVRISKSDKLKSEE